MDAELIFYIVALIIGAIFTFIIMVSPDDSIKITWGQRRDWERRERNWAK